MVEWLWWVKAITACDAHLVNDANQVYNATPVDVMLPGAATLYARHGHDDLQVGEMREHPLVIGHLQQNTSLGPQPNPNEVIFLRRL